MSAGPDVPREVWVAIRGPNRGDLHTVQKCRCCVLRGYRFEGKLSIATKPGTYTYDLHIWLSSLLSDGVVVFPKSRLSVHLHEPSAEELAERATHGGYTVTEVAARRVAKKEKRRRREEAQREHDEWMRQRRAEAEARRAAEEGEWRRWKEKVGECEEARRRYWDERVEEARRKWQAYCDEFFGGNARAPLGPTREEALRKLGLDPKTATRGDVRKAFERLALSGHPDHGGSADMHELVMLKDAALAYVDGGAV
jgi:hypothetical protein